jgi:uncharacterized protein (DUF983 family)
MNSIDLNKSHTYPSEFLSALRGKCPRCRRGEMFTSSMYSFKLQKMNEKCPHCNMKFEREPGYFYVAMFVSYAMNVAEMISAAVLTYFITRNLESPVLYMSVLFPIVFLLSPFNYRFSRVILLYWLTPGLHFNPEMSNESYEPIR